MKNFSIGVIASIALALIVFSAWINATTAGRTAWNNWFYDVQKADDDTRYETRKKVEDTCRAMMSSYESDRLVYEQYKDSSNPEKQSWGEQAKMRANKTASTYNNYVTKNDYVWANNVPNDIMIKLEYIN